MHRRREAAPAGILVLIGSGINHVHFSHGLVRDICRASIRREQDVFEPLPGIWTVVMT